MKIMLIASVASLAGTAALAQVPPAAPVAPQPPLVRPMQDHVMTRTEVVQMVRDHFGRMDADRNGAITTAELEQMHIRFAGDGKVRRFEHRLDGPGRDPNATFDRLDDNKDGSISRQEFAEGHQERIERRVERREKIGEGAKDGKDVRRFVMRGHGGGLGGRMIVMADSNKDGQITLAEAETMALQHFDRMDANRDGQVTREERRAGRPFIKRTIEEKKSGS